MKSLVGPSLKEGAAAAVALAPQAPQGSSDSCSPRSALTRKCPVPEALEGWEDCGARAEGLIFTCSLCSSQATEKFFLLLIPLRTASAETLPEGSFLGQPVVAVREHGEVGEAPPHPEPRPTPGSGS